MSHGDWRIELYAAIICSVTVGAFAVLITYLACCSHD